MEITEIRVRFANRDDDRLKAYCAVTFDDEFVVRDVRVVAGTNGLFVAMPSRKQTVACPRCGHKNTAAVKFCNDCGARQSPYVPPEDGTRGKLHRDICHPVTPVFRQHLQEQIIEAYYAECERAKDPDYQPPSLEPEEEAESTAEGAVPAREREREGGPPRERARTRQTAKEVSEYDALIADLRRTTGEPGNERGAVSRRGAATGRDERRGTVAKPLRREPARTPRRMEEPTRRPLVNRPRGPATAERPQGTSRGRVAPQRRSQAEAVPRRSTGRPMEETPAPMPPRPMPEPEREPMAESPSTEGPPPTKPAHPEPQEQPEGVPFGAGIL
jgi:stage V sporulation protein G